ncbi:ATP-binding protein [Bacillus sp. KH172YL63]|uniref:ATP-binding protein n=1 Tax=Bacillus sp. KH172YL63 TaxID=2709784 RepID=UPI0013E4CA73|nr:AAA family ATPase [Bacillus sp. KH172YL63]BCB02922.1 hypothetical protein KH172YL63_10550 [Bacillus sp. KH172YL63]
MKLIELHIYGYGKLEDKHYQLGDLQLFYGENEAGKSTIMSLIHSILFGFPTKQQAMLRYEPRSSTKYGGRLVCETADHGKVSIERMKGKATGDVTVQFEDGRIEGEETLQLLLGQMDRTTYQNIFSFNLEGLQNIHRLKKEDLNRYLFSAGSTGTDLLLQVEQDWQKEREQLFKKSGRKPRINTVLNELKSLEKEVREGRENNEQYRPLIEQRRSLESDISSLEAEKKTLGARKDELTSVNENWETLARFKDVEERLNELEGIDFPIKGLDRLNELKREERQLSASLETLKGKQEKLLKKLSADEESDTYVNERPFMEKMLSRQAFYMKWREENAERMKELKNLRAKIDDTIRELGLHIDVENIPELETGMMMADRIEQAVERQTELLHEQKSLHKVYEEEEDTLHLIEQKCDSLEDRLMEEEEYQELQRTVKAQSAQKASYEQMQWLNMQMKDAEESYRRKKSSFSGQMILSMTALVLFLGLGIWGVMSGNGILTVVCLLMVVLLGLTGMQARRNLLEEARSLQRTKSRVKELKPEEVKDIEHLDKAEHILNQQMEYRNEWKQRILALEEQEMKIHHLRNKMKDVENGIHLGEEKLNDVKEALHLPTDFHWKWLRDAFTKIKALVASYESYKQLNREVAHTRDKLIDYEKETEDWFQRHSLPFTTVDEAGVKWKHIIQALDKRQLEAGNIDSELEAISFEIEKYSNEKKKIRDEIQALFLSADCRDEEAFRERGLLDEERTSLSTQYGAMKTALTVTAFHTFLAFSSLEECRHELRRISDEVESCVKELSLRQKELATVSYEIKMLEEGKSYSALLQEFEGKKAELQELAYEWSKYTLAQASLKKTMDHYQKTKMPKVMKLAEANFRELTEGNYHRVFLIEDEMIKVERKDGAVFHAVELSQGTKEQLYIAIRFALIQSFRDKYPLPVLIDDGVVNFDRSRTRAFLSLLRNISAHHQVLFFTCHPHISESFSQEETIRLKREEKESSPTF